MNWFLFFDLLTMVIIVSLGLFTGYKVFDRIVSYKQERLRIEAAAIAKADTTEERLRVLERIATDRGHDLAAKIEQLREQRSDTDTKVLTSQQEHA